MSSPRNEDLLTPELAQSQIARISRTVAQVEHLAKASLFVISALYALGLIVSSIRLAQLGVVSADFIKPLHVLTGFWAVLPIVLGSAVLLTYKTATTTFGSRRWPLGSVGKWFFPKAFGVTASTMATALMCFAIYMLWARPASRVNPIGFGDLAGFSMLGIAAAALIALSLVASMYRKSKRDLFGLILFLGYVAFCVTTYVLLFASSMYLEVPAQLGGGRERFVGLVLKSLTGKEAQSDTSRPEIVCRLYAETSTAYVVSAVNPEQLLAAVVGQQQSKLKHDLTDDPSLTLEPNFILLPKEAVAAIVILRRVAPSQ